MRIHADPDPQPCFALTASKSSLKTEKIVFLRISNWQGFLFYVFFNKKREEKQLTKKLGMLQLGDSACSSNCLKFFNC